VNEQPVYQPPTTEPAPVPDQQPQNNYTQTTYPASPVIQTKKRNLVWLWITLGIVGLIAAIVAATLFFNGTIGSLVANQTASSYMQALRDSDDTKIKDLSGIDANDPFIINTKKGLKEASYKHIETIQKDSGYVVSFDVTNSASIKDTAVTVKDGKITNFLMNIRNKSKTATQEASIETKQSTETAVTTPSTTACLTLPDVQGAGETIYDDNASIFDHAYDLPIYYDMLFFEPDSTVIGYEPALTELADHTAKFYKALPDKNYKFQIIGSVNESSSTEAGKTLALQRAEKIKNAMVSAGVPESKIFMDSPKNETSATDPEIYRRVDINIQSAAECDKPY
jgi:outer membrane protein OmpA-like peptidoglycan-associated protein